MSLGALFFKKGTGKGKLTHASTHFLKNPVSQAKKQTLGDGERLMDWHVYLLNNLLPNIFSALACSILLRRLLLSPIATVSLNIVIQSSLFGLGACVCILRASVVLQVQLKLVVNPFQFVSLSFSFFSVSRF